jgi:hypothetical protein
MNLEQKTQISIAYFGFCLLAALGFTPCGIEHAALFILGGWTPTLAHRFGLTSEARFDAWLSGFGLLLLTMISAWLSQPTADLIHAYGLGIAVSMLVSFHCDSGVRFREAHIACAPKTFPTLDASKEMHMRLVLACVSLALIAPIFVPRAVATGNALAAQITG